MCKVFSSCTVDVLHIFNRTLCFFQNVGAVDAYNFSHTSVNYNVNLEKYIQGFISLLEELKLVLDRLYIEQNKALSKVHEYSHHGNNNDLTNSETFTELRNVSTVQNDYSELHQHGNSTVVQKFSELSTSDSQRFAELQRPSTLNSRNFLEIPNNSASLLCNSNMNSCAKLSDNDLLVDSSTHQIQNHLLPNHELKEISFSSNLMTDNSSSLVPHQNVSKSMMQNDSALLIPHQNGCNLISENPTSMVTHRNVTTDLIPDNSSSIVGHQNVFNIDDPTDKISDDQYIDHHTSGLTPGSQLISSAIESLVQETSSHQEDEDDPLNSDEITFRSLGIVNQDNLDSAPNTSRNSDGNNLIDQWSKPQNHEDINNSIVNDPEKNKSDNKKSYKCELCNKMLSSKSSLTNHMAAHTGVKPFCCEHCGKLFTMRSNLNAHLTRQHNLNTESAYSCSECGKLFVRKAALDTHLAGHRGIKPFSCYICGKKFTQKVTRNTHILTHTRNYPFQCNICSKRFTTKSKLNFHQKKHGDLQYSCSLCDKQFSTRQYLIAHYKSHNIAPEAAPCCLDTVSENSRTQVIEESQVTCPQCDLTFKSQRALTRHTKTKHNPLAPWYHCNVPNCDRPVKSFATRCQLNKHNKRHHSSENRKYSCVTCGKEFVEKVSLLHHERQNHTAGLTPRQLKSHTCHLCPKRFTIKSKLNFHIRTHTQEPQFTCNICDKSFYRKYALIKHRSTHDSIPEDKPQAPPSIPCNRCNKVFKSKNALVYHLQSHDGNYQFKCSVCDKQFVRKCHYEDHLKTHMTERPFKCSTCSRSFKTRKHWREHVKKLHSNTEVGLTMQSLLDSITNEDALSTSQQTYNVLPQEDHPPVPVPDQAQSSSAQTNNNYVLFLHKIQHLALSSPQSRTIQQNLTWVLQRSRY